MRSMDCQLPPGSKTAEPDVVTELTDGEYCIWSPYEAHEAAATLLRLLEAGTPEIVASVTVD